MFILLNLKNYFTRNVNITSGCFTYILLNDSNGTVKVNLRQRMSGNISNIKIKFLKWKLLGIWKMNIVLLHKLSIFINYHIINRDKFQTMSSLTNFKLLNSCFYKNIGFYKNLHYQKLKVWWWTQIFTRSHGSESPEIIKMNIKTIN